MHNFADSLSFGKRIETLLDNLFSKWYDIEEVSLDDEKKLGIDRIYVRKSDNTTVKVEYKADRQTLKTGNIFIELEVGGKPGWVNKTVADYVLYALVSGERLHSVLIIPNHYLKQMLPIWEQLPKKVIQNKGFYGIGVLVPLKEIQTENVVKVIKEQK